MIRRLLYRLIALIFCKLVHKAEMWESRRIRDYCKFMADVIMNYASLFGHLAIAGNIGNLLHSSLPLHPGVSMGTSVKLGSLMIIAWAFLPSIGIILARFYKPMWPNTKLNATAVWFQIHRGCMVMVFICNAVAFVVIFVDVGEYSSFTTSWHAGHPIMGIIATALSIANPIMSIFRCHPGTKNRPLFNWAHWAVGMSAWILGTIAIFFALRLDRVTAYINQNAIYVMAALVAYESVFIIAMDIIQCYSSKESRKKESYQMKAVGDKSDEDTSKPKPPASKLKNFLLAMHFLIMLSLSVTLIVLINLEKEETHADNGH